MKLKCRNAIAALSFLKKNDKKTGENPLDYEVHLANAKNSKVNAAGEYSPLISVLAKSPHKRLETSLGKQNYSNWELVHNESGANGDFVLLLTDDAVLTDDALSSFVNGINDNSDADMIYADEDCMGLNSVRSNPFFKPDHSETTLLSYNCIGIPIMISKDIFSKLVTVDMSDEDALYDTALRCSAYAQKIVHIKKVLVSRTGVRKTVSEENGLLAIKAYLQFKRRPMLMERGIARGTFHVKCMKKEKTVLGIVILNGADIAPLRRLLESIEDCILGIPKKTVVVNYGKNDARAQKYYELLEESKAVKVIYCAEKNYSKLCNRGAGECDCDILLFLDASMEIISPVHIKNLMDSVVEGKSGAVCCKITDTGGKIYDCGTVVGLFGRFGSLYAGEEDESAEELKNRFTNVKRTVSAVSHLCFMISRNTFYNSGGFDETVKNPDAAIEFSLRLMRKGLENVYDPFTVMIKHDDGEEWEKDENDESRIYGTIRPMLISGDPYYNPNYDYASKTPQIAPVPYPPIELNQNYDKRI